MLDCRPSVRLEQADSHMSAMNVGRFVRGELQPERHPQ